MNCGYVALIGRPNVGKSTLMNHLLGQKISITSRKPQTTRHQIIGIKTTALGQAIFVDTPGMHDGEQRALNRYLNRTADTSLLGVDQVIWLVDSLEWQAYDDVIIEKLKRVDVPVILAVNKVDRVKDKQAMLPFLSGVGEKYPFAEIIPVSALKGNNLEQLEQLIMARLPESALIYPEDQITDRPERFLSAEIIREKLIRRLGQELPHALTVEIERYEETPAITRIYAVVWVERDTQKNIVIGKQGGLLKSIGTDARQDIEILIDHKVYLQLWVKVKKGWANNERALNSLGFND